MSQPPTIPYQSGLATARVAAPSEFDHAYEQERGRWLRRRFLYYAGVSLGFGLLMALPTLYIAAGSQTDRPSFAEQALILLISNLVYASAFIVAWRARPDYRRILRIAFLTYVSASLLAITFTHIYFLYSSLPAAEASFQQGRSVGARMARARVPVTRPTTSDATDATTRPEITLSTREGTARASADAAEIASLFEGPVRYSYVDKSVLKVGSARPSFTLPWAIDNAVYALMWGSLLFSLAFNHFFISLFLPWTVRESRRPALIIASGFVIMVAVDWLFGGAWWPVVLVACACLPFVFLPGTVICWWRYSRFNKQFKQRFESDSFKKLQADLIGARKIHEANLPAPITAGPIRVSFDYEPMREIGGDLLMLHRGRDGNAVTAVLFDVTGHGVSAALSVNRIVGEIERTFAMDADASPELLICNLNKYIFAILAKHQIYATAIVLRIDAKAGTLEYVNAGHPPGIAFGPFDSSTLLSPTAMMLGVCEGDEFDCQMVRLDFAQSGLSSLVLYTDGASEALDPDDRMLCVEGTLNFIRDAALEHGNPAKWPAAIHDRVVAHRQSPPTDDTLVVAMWRA